jgi:hypothetical protein
MRKQVTLVAAMCCLVSLQWRTAPVAAQEQPAKSKETTGPEQKAPLEQKAPADAESEKPKLDALARFDASFQKREPLVGTQVALVDAWDAAGDKIQVGGVPGKYTVLVFGCLT